MHETSYKAAKQGFIDNGGDPNEVKEYDKIHYHIFRESIKRSQRKYRQDPTIRFYYSAKNTARILDVDFNISRQDVRDCLTERCRYTGRELEYIQGRSDNLNKAYLIRIDYSKPYSADNIEVVSKEHWIKLRKTKKA